MRTVDMIMMRTVDIHKKATKKSFLNRKQSNVFIFILWVPTQGHKNVPLHLSVPYS